MLVNFRKTSCQGFTLVEVLVVMGVTLLLGVTVLNVFLQSRTSLTHASGRIELIQLARIPTERIGYYLSSSVTIPSLEAVVFPVLESTATPTNIFGTTILEDDPRTWDQVIVFRTTEDFFAEVGEMGYEFDPDSIMNVNDIKNNIEVWERDDQRLTEYVIWFEDDTNIDWIPNESGVLAIARFDDLTLSENRDLPWVNTWFTSGDPTSSFHPGVDIRIIGRRLEMVGFRRRLQNGIQMAVETKKAIRNASNGLEDKSFRLDTVIQLPTLTLN